MRRISVGGMSRPPKPAATAKKVPPPAVPHEFRHSGSSFGSAGYASSEDAAFLPNNEPANISRDDHSDYGSTVSSTGTGKSPGPIFPSAAFTFPSGGGGGTIGTGPPPPSGLLTHKAAVYYHHQLSLQEDQGIDMTQSPGRDSPGSSSGSGSGSRHSTASLDSGRASYHPLSAAGGRSTAGSTNSPRCSLSSCSIGSDQGRIERMIHQGVPDQEIIHTWLVDLHYEEYFPLFVSAGYDLPTIGRMTPEDLTAIGIKKPNHRKRLKAEIAQLNLPDNLPEFIPGSLEEWLQVLHLDEYLPAFLDQNYQSVDDVVQLTWEDLEEFGIVKLGHQKKLMLAIKRVKDIRAGKRLIYDTGRSFGHQKDAMTVHQHGASPQQTNPSSVTFRSFHQAPCCWDQDHRISYNAPGTHYVHHFCTDIVPIKIRTGRGKSLESLEDPCERTHLTFAPDAAPIPTFYYQAPPIGWRARSYDDGDITPTNEPSLMFEGGGTLPRPRGVCRPRPVAKIAAKVREPFPEFDSRYAVTKKSAPEPPRRRDSTAESDRTTTVVEVHHVMRSSPLPLPAYPSSDSLSISLEEAHAADLPLPPPPAPATPPHKMNASQSWGAEEQELIKSLAQLQHRNGSDASFKSSSSTESDSLPFANENAGTIRTRAPTTSSTPGGRVSTSDSFPSPAKSRPLGLPTHPSSGVPSNQGAASNAGSAPTGRGRGNADQPVDVLNDIGNMLANLTDELDAMLEEEKRQQ